MAPYYTRSILGAAENAWLERRHLVPLRTQNGSLCSPSAEQKDLLLLRETKTNRYSFATSYVWDQAKHKWFPGCWLLGALAEVYHLATELMSFGVVHWVWVIDLGNWKGTNQRWNEGREGWKQGTAAPGAGVSKANLAATKDWLCTPSVFETCWDSPVAAAA